MNKLTQMIRSNKNKNRFCEFSRRYFSNIAFKQWEYSSSYITCASK